MATGAIVGGLLGGALGGIPTLGLGTGTGFALGSSLGGLAEGAVQWGQANKKQISATDPRTRLLYDEIVRKRKGLETGTMYQPQQDVITQAGARAMQAATGITGGDIGATVSALGAINRGTGRNLNELYGNMMNQSNQMLGQQMGVNQMLYNWNYQRQAYDKQQAMAHAAQTLRDSMANLNSVIASKGGLLDNAGLSGNNTPVSQNNVNTFAAKAGLTGGATAAANNEVPQIYPKSSLMPPMVGVADYSQTPAQKVFTPQMAEILRAMYPSTIGNVMPNFETINPNVGGLGYATPNPSGVQSFPVFNY